MPIFHAEPMDLPVIAEMGMAMAAESPKFRQLGYDPEKAEDVFERLMVNDSLWVAIVEGEVVGAIGGVVTPYWWGSASYGLDMFNYLMPEHRGGLLGARLVRTLEAWAAEQGAQEMIMGVSSGIHPERTGELYQRLGYEQTAVAYSKPLTSGA